jgi:hypothetical protein
MTEFGTQFFILHRSAMDAVLDLRVQPGKTVERAFFEAFTAHHALDRVLPMAEREPVHPHQRYQCEALALYAQHWPACGSSRDPRPRGRLLQVDEQAEGKREVLQRYLPQGRGPHLQRLLRAGSLDYYNAGALHY